MYLVIAHKKSQQHKNERKRKQAKNPTCQLTGQGEILVEAAHIESPLLKLRRCHTGKCTNGAFVCMPVFATVNTYNCVPRALPCACQCARVSWGGGRKDGYSRRFSLPIQSPPGAGTHAGNSCWQLTECLAKEQTPPHPTPSVVAPCCSYIPSHTRVKNVAQLPQARKQAMGQKNFWALPCCCVGRNDSHKWPHLTLTQHNGSLASKE